MKLREGAYYRNGLGDVMLIVGQVVPGSKWYEKGARFVDCRGSFYLTDGTMNTWAWKSLELIAEVDVVNVTEAEMMQVQLRVLDGGLISRAKPVLEHSHPSLKADQHTLDFNASRNRSLVRSGNIQPTVVSTLGSDEEPAPRGIPIELSTQSLKLLNDGARAALQIGDLASSPTYEAYLTSGREMYQDKLGKLHPEHRVAGKINEKAKISKVSVSPAQIANIAFQVVSILVAQEHLARIDQNLSGLATSLADLKSIVLDEIAAPIRVAASSLDRLSGSGKNSLPPAVVLSWLLDLRKSRERLSALVEIAVAKVESLTARSDFLKAENVRVLLNYIQQANSIIELLITCDSLIERYRRDNSDDWATDGIDFGLPFDTACKIYKLGRDFVSPVVANGSFRLQDGIEDRLFPALGRTRQLVDASDRVKQIQQLLPVLESGQNLILSFKEGEIIGVDELIPA